jgi:hypothetical protein
MKYARDKKAMEMSQEKSTKLVWAVLCQGPTGRSEVIKITDHEDADRTIQNNPSMYFKSGPIVMSA